MDNIIRTGLIGYGYWGPNLLRNFQSHPAFQVTAVADANPKRLDAARPACPGAALYRDSNELIEKADVDAVVVATPVASHFQLAMAALEGGKHVLVEKPLCYSSADGEMLLQKAAQNDLVLMVDHTFLFTGAVQALRKMYVAGEIGEISYYDSMRVNLGLFQPDVNVMWDLAPHDLSIMDYILNEEPSEVEVSGYSHVNHGIPDIVYMNLYFPSHKVAHFNLSWMSPVKVRRTAIGGTDKMIVWDDLNREEKIKIYNSGIHFQPEEERRTIMPDYRLGDIFSPRITNREALAGVVDHFAAVIEKRVQSIMDGNKGLRIVRILEQAQSILDAKASRSPKAASGT